MHVGWTGDTVSLAGLIWSAIFGRHLFCFLSRSYLSCSIYGELSNNHVVNLMEIPYNPVFSGDLPGVAPRTQLSSRLDAFGVCWCRFGKTPTPLDLPLSVVWQDHEIYAVGIDKMFGFFANWTRNSDVAGADRCPATSDFPGKLWRPHCLPLELPAPSFSISMVAWSCLSFQILSIQRRKHGS